jgi:hypothetical protein
LLHYLSDTHSFQIFHLESTSTIGIDDVAFSDVLQNDGNGLVVGGKMQLNHAHGGQYVVNFKDT